MSFQRVFPVDPAGHYLEIRVLETCNVWILGTHWTRGRGLPPQSDRHSVDQPSFHESTARGDETFGLQRSSSSFHGPRVLQGYESFEANRISILTLI